MSHPSSGSEEIPSQAPRTTSLAATAAMNAGLQRESTNEESEARKNSVTSATGPSPVINPRSPTDRQRNSIAMNLSLNDPALPAPGEMQPTSATSETRSRTIQSPPIRNQADRSRSSSIATRHHGRQPSVGEVYQEMEQEQEAQVNRLLQTIRLQQQQLAAFQSDNGGSISPISERRQSITFASGHPPPSFSTGAGGPQSPLATAIRSRRQSQTSPAPVRSVPTGYQLSQSLSHDQENAIASPPAGQVTPILPTPTSSVSGSARDEVAFYQAEVQSLSRENQMLKTRIKELERQVTSPNALAPTISASTVPALASHLSQETSVDEDMDLDTPKI